MSRSVDAEKAATTEAMSSMASSLVNARLWTPELLCVLCERSATYMPMVDAHKGGSWRLLQRARECYHLFQTCTLTLNANDVPLRPAMANFGMKTAKR